MAHMYRFVVASSHKQAEELFLKDARTGHTTVRDAEAHLANAHQAPEQRLRVVKLLINVTATGRDE